MTLVSVVSYSYLLSSQLWFMSGNFTKITYCKANIIDAHSYYVNVSPSLKLEVFIGSGQRSVVLGGWTF